MRLFLAAVSGAMILSSAGCVTHPPLQTVAHVDLKRYAGFWHEIARYPNRFEKNCKQGTSTAEYTLRADGKVDVENRCVSKSGRKKLSEGTARVVDKEKNAKLAVTFFWPFEGSYWIIDLDPEYRWAVVGEPSRKYLWILAREPSLPKDVLDGILSRLPDKGYDPSKLMIEQPQ